jgi:subtilisin family serine protease
LEIYLQSKGEIDLEIGGLDDTEILPENLTSYVNLVTGQMVVSVAVPAGAGGVYLHSGQGAGTPGDAYLSGPGAQFSEESYELGKVIASPSAASTVLSIGSYDWNDQFHFRGSVTVLFDDQLKAPLKIGGLSTYSSRGPLRIGSHVKPELTAPGQYHIAPAPLNVVTMRDTTGLYQPFNGTSSATPYTAGVIALLLEANPQLTWGEIRQLLTKNLTQDGHTGKCPNSNWGHGKLDYAAVERLVAAVRAAQPAAGPPAGTKK